jgi:uncharacterized protein
MRLKPEEARRIISTVYGFDAKARVYLFGSRTDDRKLGGDIDLLIESAVLTPRDKRKIKLRLYEQLGEQKIDLILSAAADPAFLEHIRSDLVLLK